SGNSCARIGRHDTGSLDPIAIGTGAFVLDLVVNGEVTFWRWFVRKADGNGRRHQAAVPFHDIDVLLRKRKGDPNLGRVLRLMGIDMILGRRSGRHCRATCKEAERNQWNEKEQA